MTLTALVIYGLAVWRISSLFVREDGPAYIFRRLREWVGFTHDEQGDPVIIPDTFFGGIFSCVWCFSIWVAFFWTIMFLMSGECSLKLATPFAISAAAIVIDKWVKQ